MKNTLDKTKEIKVLLSQLRAFCNTVDQILNNANTAETARYTSYRDMASIPRLKYGYRFHQLEDEDLCQPPAAYYSHYHWNAILRW